MGNTVYGDYTGIISPYALLESSKFTAEAEVTTRCLYGDIQNLILKPSGLGVEQWSTN